MTRSRTKPGATPAQTPARKIRCAIYTRKSSEEGLDMAFNSLDAQREACSAYIASQRAEGWVELPEFYDDGGVSGGTLERPALRRLLADIEARRVDVVVVYKIDRLSRALMDFAVSAGIKLTHLAGVKLIHLGKDGGQEAADVDPGGSSGDPSFGKTRGKSSGDSAADGLFAQHGAAISA
jgi:hypothetical protein